MNADTVRHKTLTSAVVATGFRLATCFSVALALPLLGVLASARGAVRFAAGRFRLGAELEQS
jgi:hypothetical protein